GSRRALRRAARATRRPAGRGIEAQPRGSGGRHAGGRPRGAAPHAHGLRRLQRARAPGSAGGEAGRPRERRAARVGDDGRGLRAPAHRVVAFRCPGLAGVRAPRRAPGAMSVHAFIAPRSGIWEERPPQEVVVPEQLSAFRIVEIARGFMSSKVLLVAAKLHLFDDLRDGALTGEELRKRLGLHPRAIPDFLDALVALRILDREGDGSGARYANSPESARFLVRSSEDYAGGFLEMFNDRLFRF